MVVKNAILLMGIVHGKKGADDYLPIRCRDLRW
jgi:hypothetical protein